jgi:hypothetical protein
MIWEFPFRPDCFAVFPRIASARIYLAIPCPKIDGLPYDISSKKTSISNSEKDDFFPN